MNIASAKWFRGLLLSSIYLLGVLGIVGSTGGGSWKPCPECVDSSPPQPEPDLISNDVHFIATALDGSDDVYVGGSFTIFQNSAANHFARLNNDCSLDTSFITDTEDVGANRIARLNNDGSFDTSFITGTGFNDDVTIIAPANDGSGDVYVGGGFTSYNSSAAGHIARLNLDGTLDAAFDTGTGFSSGTDFISGVANYSSVVVVAPAIDGSGDVYVGGVFTSYNGTDVGGGLVRLNADGSLDTGFLPTGSISVLRPYGIAPANDGSGDVYAIIGPSIIARLNSDGSRDADFDTGLSGFNDKVLAIAVAIDGSGDVYASGFFSDYNGMGRNNIARLNSDGSLDAGFVPSPTVFFFALFFALAIDGSGDIYVSSSFGGTISRLNDNGSIDTGFDMGSGGKGVIHDMAPVTDGSGDIYVGGGGGVF